MVDITKMSLYVFKFSKPDLSLTERYIRLLANYKPSGNLVRQIPIRVFMKFLRLALFMIITLGIGFFTNSYAFNGYHGEFYISGALALIMYTSICMVISFSRIASFCVFPFLSLLCVSSEYFYRLTGAPIRYDSIAFLLEADAFEVESFLSFKLVLFLSLGVLLGILQAIGAKSVKPASLKQAAFVLVLVGCGIGVYQFSMQYLKDEGYGKIRDRASMSKINPTASFKAVKMYLREEEKVEKLLSLPGGNELPSSLVFKESDKPIIIFIIGESTRGDHFSINGYHRNTNPYLEKLSSDSLINYGVAISFATSTRKSLIGMLTNASTKKRTPSVGSFITFFNKNNYNTHFYSVQNKLGRSGYLTDALVSSSKVVEYLKPHGAVSDELLVEKLGRVLPGLNGNQLILLHTRGSHFSYRDNYQDEYVVFKPDTYTNETLRKETPNVINAYDNNMLKVDKTIYDIIDLCKEKNAVVVYASDHGESLGEDGSFFHAQGRPEHHKIPFLIWTSDKYKELHSDKHNNMVARVGVPVTHDQLFHTMLGLAGIKSPVIDNSLDLTSVLQ